ncbi:UNVERIFIED_CONTAM: hypothetical protein HDU68_008151 [Siphonaria sp. JEL0065]|nr:hypothetical protein HDU68_008151 [Siphonaria sp. JEL0065]
MPDSLLSLLANNATTASSYTSMHPAISNFWFLIAIILATFVVSTATGNYSQVDRLWSITPIFFVANYAIVASLRGFAVNARLVVMSVLVLFWGCRLTFNFARKGGYRWKDEDYRWPYLRGIITNPVLWHLFSFFFICAYQNMLLYLITLPAKTAFDAVVEGGGAWSVVDTVALILFVGLLVLETVADQQQWNFQETKWGMIKEGKKLEDLPAPYNVGFLTTGLFAFSRHPNFFAEFSQWWALYLFSIGANGQWNPEAIVGTVLLTLLFLGSAPFTEYITVQKYPLYLEYQKKVSMLIPWIPLREPLVAAVPAPEKEHV